MCILMKKKLLENIKLNKGEFNMNEIVLDLINQADLAIKEERFDDLMEFYMDDAILVVKPGLEVQG